jgi:hypothetical protein
MLAITLHIVCHITAQVEAQLLSFSLHRDLKVDRIPSIHGILLLIKVLGTSTALDAQCREEAGEHLIRPTITADVTSCQIASMVVG